MLYASVSDLQTVNFVLDKSDVFFIYSLWYRLSCPANLLSFTTLDCLITAIRCS